MRKCSATMLFWFWTNWPHVLVVLHTTSYKPIIAHTCAGPPGTNFVTCKGPDALDSNTAPTPTICSPLPESIAAPGPNPDRPTKERSHRRESWATPQGHRPANPAGGIEMRLTPVLCLCPLGYDIIESESGGVGFLPSSPPSPRREEDSSVAAQAGRPVLKSCMAGPGSGAPGDSEPESQSDRRSRSLTHCHRDCPGQRASRDVGSLPCHRHGAHGRGRRASSLCDSKTITMERGIKLIIYLKAAALRRRRGRFKL